MKILNKTVLVKDINIKLETKFKSMYTQQYVFTMVKKVEKKLNKKSFRFYSAM